MKIKIMHYSSMKHPLYNLPNKNIVEISITTIETYVKEFLYHGAEYKKMSNKDIDNAINIILDKVADIEKSAKEINEKSGEN